MLIAYTKFSRPNSKREKMELIVKLDNLQIDEHKKTFPSDIYNENIEAPPILVKMFKEGSWSNTVNK